jgi:hypothetical protein
MNTNLRESDKIFDRKERRREAIPGTRPPEAGSTGEYKFRLY